MAKHEVKPGDTVKLRSGGPTMTAQYMNNQGWKCSWFDADNLKEGYFALNSLKVIEPFASDER
jgi:uncharacterized protein YodC (DUF2158 family)